MAKHSPSKRNSLQRRQALLAKATAGDAEAQFQMGERCREGGSDDEADLAGALRWYRAAAEQGHANAQNAVGSMYYNGLGVPSDFAEAAKWYRLACSKNLPWAMFNLGVQLRDGLGVETDPGEAMRLINAAADADYTIAQFYLGQMYHDGDRVPVDLVKSAEFFIQAASQGHINSMGYLCDMEDRLQALATSGSKDAALCLKEMYAAGLGVPRSRKNWTKWGLMSGRSLIDSWEDLPEGFGDKTMLHELFFKQGKTPEDLPGMLPAERKAYAKYIKKRGSGVSYQTLRDADEE